MLSAAAGPAGGDSSLAAIVVENPEAREACRQGRDDMRAGRRRQAIEAFRRAVALDPGRTDCRVALATALLREFRWREAEFHYREALARAGSDSQRELLRIGVGEALERRGAVAEAIRSYEQALELSPGSPRALGHLAIARRRSGDLEGAVSAWKTYLEKIPGDAAAIERLEETLRLGAELRVLEEQTGGPGATAQRWDALARARAAAGDPQAVLRARRRAAELSPGDAGRELALALALLAGGETAPAAGALEDVLRLDPQRGAAYAHLADVAERAGDPAAERRVWERLLEQQPLNLVAIRRLVELETRASTLPAGADDLARRLEKAGSGPRGAGLAVRLALVRAAAGDRAGADEAFALALDSEPNDPAVQNALRDHLRRGAVAAQRKAGPARRRGAAPEGDAEARQSAGAPGPALRRASRLGRALVEAQRAAEGGSGGAVRPLSDLAAAHPERPDLRAALADALASLGRTGEARVEYERALAAAPKHRFAGLGLALLALNSGGSAEAERRAREVLKEHPRDAYGLAVLATALFRGGRLEEAGAAAAAALEVDPWEQVTSVRFLLGRSLAGRGDLRAAEEAVRGELPRSGWLLYDQTWEFARDMFLGDVPAADWEKWRRRPGEIRGGEEEVLPRVADFLASLAERYTRLRTPEETLDVYFSRRPDAPDLVAGRTSDANRAVIARRLGENLAYLKLADFQTPEIAAVVRQILQELKDAPGLVLDLRGNPGGLKDEARKVAEMLVAPGTPLEIEERRDGAAAVRAGDEAGLYPDRPLVVLVDGDTASAAESLAGMLQSSGRATIVGDPTRGKGVSQAVRLLPGGYSLLVTAGQSFDPSGVPLHGRGVIPGTSGEGPEAADPALEKARDLLSP